jgi:hypothetical protein
MEEEYKFNFKGLARFLDDFKFLKGGSNILSGGSFAEMMTNFTAIIIGLLWLAVFAFIIYTVYIILFKGYPRWFLNLITFKFYHKENIHQLLNDNIVLYKIQNILSSKGQCINPLDAIFDIYGKDSSIYPLVVQLDTTIKKYYFKLSGIDKKYQEALKEYYLYYHKIEDTAFADIVPDINVVDSNGHPIHRKVQHIAFYQTVLAVQLNDGLISAKNEGAKPGNKGDDQLLWEVYTKDKSNQNGYYKRILEIHTILKQLSKEINILATTLKETSLIPFIILTPDINELSIELGNKINDIKSGTIYNYPAKYIKKEYGWFIVEVLTYLYNPNYYFSVIRGLDNQEPFYNKEEIDTIRYYLNLTKDNRTDVENKIFNRKFVRKEPGWVDFGQNDTEQNYAQKTSGEFMDLLRTHPILSNLYFSGHLDMYPKIMKMYLRFMTNCTGQFTDIKTIITNLNNNGIAFKNFVNSINLLDLYLNSYQTQITQLLEDQQVTVKEFFHKLFNPYFDDIVKGRMKTYYKKTFSIYTWKKSYNKFMVWWRSLGDMLKNIIVSIWKSFFTGNDAEEPQPDNLTAEDDSG